MLSFTGGRTMHVAQSGIFALGTGSHSYLEFDLHGRSGQFTLVQLIASVEEPRMTTGSVNLVGGFKPALGAHGEPEGVAARVTDLEHAVRVVDGDTMPA